MFHKCNVCNVMIDRPLHWGSRQTAEICSGREVERDRWWAAMMLQLSHGNPPRGSSANSSEAGLVSCFLMQQKCCAPRTSPLGWANSRRRWCSHPEIASERECDDWRGVSLIHQSAASLRQSAAMVLTDTWAPAHKAHARQLKGPRIRCVTAKLQYGCWRNPAPFFIYLFPFQLRENVPVWCRAAILQCSTTPHYSEVASHWME